MSIVMQQTRGISSVLSSKNPIFADGQMIWEQDTDKLKFGDGISRYVDLPYVNLVCDENSDSTIGGGDSTIGGGDSTIGGGDSTIGGGDSTIGGGDSTVELLPVGTSLNDATWEQISAVAKAGKGADYWNIGDCKEITLNGKIGANLTLSNEDFYVFILDFNVPENGVADNNIIWGCFKTSVTNGVDITLVDPNLYDQSKTNGTKSFNMNHWGASNHGGWKGCDLRYDILGATHLPPSGYGAKAQAGRIGYDATAETLTNPKADTFLAALPADLRSVLRLWKRYADAVGDIYGTADGTDDTSNSYIQETIDAVSLLTEHELFGGRAYANWYERFYNKQLAYYANGNPKLKYRHTEYTANANQWACSVANGSNSRFCCVTPNNTVSIIECSRIAGISPVFKT